MNIIQRIKNFNTGAIDFASNSYQELIDNLMEVSLRARNLKKSNIKLAALHLANGSLADAIFRYWLLIRFFNYSPPQLLYDYGRCYLYKESHIKALDLFKQALEKEPDNNIFEHRVTSLTNPESIKTIPIEVVKEDYNFLAHSYQKFVKDSKYSAPQILLEELHAFIIKHYKEAELKPETVLDIGCGLGICGYLASTMFDATNVYGIDIADKMVEKAKQFNKTDKTFTAIYNDNYLVFDDYKHKIDLAMACFSMQFTADLDSAIKKVKSISSKKLVFAFAVPYTRNHHSFYDVNNRCFCYTRSYISELLLKHEFSDFTISEKEVSDSTEALIVIARI